MLSRDAKVGLAAVAVAAALMGFVVSRPSTFHVERSATIAAPAEVVFACIDTFTAWDEWSPWWTPSKDLWKKLEDPRSGVGARVQWDSEIGVRELAITDSVVNKRVAMDLLLPEPDSPARIAFVLAPDSGSTSLVWSVDGDIDLVGKVRGLLSDPSRVFVADLEEGLASLTAAAEADAAAATPRDQVCRHAAAIAKARAKAEADLARMIAEKVKKGDRPVY